MYRSTTIDDYLNDLAGNMSAPGGGSGSANVAALGAALASMTANFTLGKKKYAEVEDEVKALLDRTEKLREVLTAGIDADVEAYGKYSEASKMPKETDEEKAARKVVLQEALRGAMGVPLDIMRSAAALMDEAKRIAEIGNSWLITDAGCAALFGLAGLRGASLNVQINLGYIDDKELVEKTRKEVEEMIAKATQTEKETMDLIAKALS